MRKPVFREQFISLVKRKKMSGILHLITDRVSFFQILLIWITIAILFGLVYFFSTTEQNHLYHISEQSIISDLPNCIYYSFIAATTTGFGDIIPVGYFKLIAVIQVIFGLLLLAVVTSKLVSIKQDRILTEIYELSLNEKVSKVRSSLLLYRQNLDRVLTKLEEKTISAREISSIYHFFASFEDTLDEVSSLLSRRNEEVLKDIDNVSLELLLNGMISSMTKTNELLIGLDEFGAEWRSELNFNLLNLILAAGSRILDNMGYTTLPKLTRKEMNSRFSSVSSSISNRMNHGSSFDDLDSSNNAHDDL